MSQAEFCYCFDCDEVGFVVPPNNGVFRGMNDGASQHNDCHIHIFGNPNDYVPPIRNWLVKLKSNLNISVAEEILFCLAIDLGELAGIPDARGIVNGGLKELPEYDWQGAKDTDPCEILDLPDVCCVECKQRVAETMSCAIDGHRVGWFTAACENFVDKADSPRVLDIGQLNLFDVAFSNLETTTGGKA